ncbi:MAG: hypothetical protein KDJ22_02430 [Candidatus Competibacteraceae bacterium]|mgnify:CR=1 FL=1|nr:hypothetical protein [Candidatus Competibacteraceae bacterium]MCP5124913.1 hypothetical protein [Gammaproteobacteria bacterium]HRX70979.1 hypothetical protein [Candidatus Competibacteraceae bacterium]
MPNKEKCLESIHIHTGESLKRDLQDLAMLESRAVGEYARAVLDLHVYGARSRLERLDAEEKARSPKFDR